jgi:hypothetical protein
MNAGIVQRGDFARPHDLFVLQIHESIRGDTEATFCRLSLHDPDDANGAAVLVRNAPLTSAPGEHQDLVVLLNYDG